MMNPPPKHDGPATNLGARQLGTRFNGQRLTHVGIALLDWWTKSYISQGFSIRFRSCSRQVSLTCGPSRFWERLLSFSQNGYWHTTAIFIAWVGRLVFERSPTLQSSSTSPVRRARTK